MDRSREKNSDRGCGPLSSSKIYNPLYKPRKILSKIFLASGASRAVAGIFWNFFGVYSVCSRVPELTRIYNQNDLISAVGLNHLIK